MRKVRLILSALLLCFAGLTAFPQDSPTQLEIKLAQTAVTNNEEFSVSTAIRNTGSEEQVLEIWACGYPNRWKADNLSVHVVNEGCLKNTPFKVQLKPGRAYERKMQIRVELAPGSSQHESVTFRLGIEGGDYGTAWKVSPIWSNAVTVNVTR
jgi:hypothetical protein